MISLLFFSVKKEAAALMNNDPVSVYDSFAEQAALGLYTLKKSIGHEDGLWLSDLAGLSTEQCIAVLRTLYSEKEDEE